MKRTTHFKLNQPPSGRLLHFSLWWLDPCLQESWELTGDTKACVLSCCILLLGSNIHTSWPLGFSVKMASAHLSRVYTQEIEHIWDKGGWMGPDVTLRAIYRPSATAVPHAVQLCTSSLVIQKCIYRASIAFWNPYILTSCIYRKKLPMMSLNTFTPSFVVSCFVCTCVFVE